MRIFLRPLIRISLRLCLIKGAHHALVVARVEVADNRPRIARYIHIHAALRLRHRFLPPRHQRQHRRAQRKKHIKAIAVRFLHHNAEQERRGQRADAVAEKQAAAHLYRAHVVGQLIIGPRHAQGIKRKQAQPE